MKIISTVQGTTMLHVSGDDVMPPGGLMIRDLVEFVATTYSFSVKPELPPGIAPFAIQTFTFQSGELRRGDEKWPIVQLSILPNGDMLTAKTTEVADAIMDDYTSRLDSVLGYRFSQAPQRRTHYSTLVVQFELGIENKLRALGAIEDVLNSQIPRPNDPFKVKRIAFGYGDPTGIPTQFSMEAFDKSDFVIERRASHPYAENRYFCIAPTTTTEHIRILGLVEEAMS